MNDLAEHWTVGKWHDYDNYLCAHCQFSTLSRQQIEEHVITRHLPPTPQPRVIPNIVDRFGNPVVIEPEETTHGEN